MHTSDSTHRRNIIHYCTYMHSLLPPVGFGVLIIYFFKLIERKSSVVVLHETREIITLTVGLGNRWISLS